MKAALALVNIRHFVQPDFVGQALRLPTLAAEALRCMPSGKCAGHPARAHTNAAMREFSVTEDGAIVRNPQHDIANCTELTTTPCLLESPRISTRGPRK